MTDVEITDEERAIAADYVRLLAMGRMTQLRHPLFARRTRRAYRRVNPYPFGRYTQGCRLGDVGRHISETYYGFTVGKFAYRYEQFWYAGVNLESIGAFTSLAPNITLTGMNHPLAYVTTSPITYLEARGFVQSDRLDRMNPGRNQRVRIGNDVWIGQNVTILPNITISDGAVVGAGSVVTKDVEPYAIVAGNPARLIRKRFEDDVIRRLLALQWWNWEDDAIAERLDLFVEPSRFLDALAPDDGDNPRG